MIEKEKQNKPVAQQDKGKETQQPGTAVHFTALQKHLIEQEARKNATGVDISKIIRH